MTDKYLPASEPPATLAPTTVVSGVLHIYVAFDWGDEIDLEQAQRLVPAAAAELARRRRTPASIAYRPAPLIFPLAPFPMELPELGQAEISAEATVFDLGAASVGLHIPFRLSAEALLRLAGQLGEAQHLVRAAATAAEPLVRRLEPAIKHPSWSPLQEEYLVFHFQPGAPLPPPERLCETEAAWLAGLLRLESAPLSTTEVADALRQRMSYSLDDLFLTDWAAAVLVDRDCEETLRTIEFANVQLLELRHLDQRLDDRLAEAYRAVHPLAQRWMPFWRTHAHSLRSLGELQVETLELLERTGNVLKLVGDQYLSRVYRLLAGRFHLDAWGESVNRSLDVTQGVYQVVASQATTYRTEVLELIIIVLIALEIVMALFRS